MDDPMPNVVSTVLELAGVGVVLYGIAMIWVPLAVITFGIVMVLVGFGLS